LIINEENWSVSSSAAAPTPGLNEPKTSVPPFSKDDELITEPVTTTVEAKGTGTIIFFDEEQPQIKRIINKNERFLIT